MEEFFIDLKNEAEEFYRMLSPTDKAVFTVVLIFEICSGFIPCMPVFAVYCGYLVWKYSRRKNRE